MTDPIRSALKRLLSAVLDGLGQDDHPMGWARVDDAIDAARAALAAKPVGEGSSDEYLNRVYQGAYQPAWERGEFHGAHYDGLRAVAAAVAADLLEQRHPAPVPPVEGEVGELMAWLRDRAESTSLAHAARRITRAADLLEQRHPAPVPVAERLPGLEDCDAEHYCWRWNTIGGLWARQPLARSWYEFESHWLPATALPLPQGEVEE